MLDVRFLGPENSHVVVASNSPCLKVFELQTSACQILHGHTGQGTKPTRSSFWPGRMTHSLPEQTSDRPLHFLPDIVLALDVFRKGWLFASCAKVRRRKERAGPRRGRPPQPLSSPILSPGSEHPHLEDKQGWIGGLCGSGLWAHTQRGHHLLLKVSGSGLRPGCPRGTGPGPPPRGRRNRWLWPCSVSLPPRDME